MHEPGKKIGPSRGGWDQPTGNQFSDADLDRLLAELKAPGEIVPVPGFYSRVLDRVDSQKSKSIWAAFLEPLFGRRLAMASAVAMLLLGTALFVPGSEVDDELMAQGRTGVVVNEGQPAPVLTSDHPLPIDGDSDSVLVNLVTYQEH